MGFHEGARRIVRCDGGHITGFYVYVSHLGGYSEPTANAIRVICSSSRIQLEFETGSFPDTMVFGNLPEASQPVKGDANGAVEQQHLLPPVLHYMPMCCLQDQDFTLPRPYCCLLSASVGCFIMNPLMR